jgi:predicted enzyme related to lactoylglutathione lyase
MGNPVVHFEFASKDRERLSSYYSELFGWNVDANNPMNYGMISREENMTDDGMGIGGGIGEAPDGHDGHLTVYVAVPDVEEALTRAESLGGKRMMGPETIPDMLILGQFTDPDGNLVGVMTPLGQDA